MSSAPTSSTPSSSSTKSSRPSCATSWSPTISPISASRRDWTISTRSASASKPSRAALLASRHSGSMFMSTSRCSSALPSRSPSARSAIPASRSTTPVSSASSKSSCTAALRLAAGPPSKPTHHAVLTSFHLSARAYGLNQLRYDLRKLKGHGLLQRDGSRYAYRLTPKGVQVALLFLFFHKRLCGPLANSCFHHRPDPAHQPASKLEAAYHRADNAIQQIVDLLAA